MTLAIIAVVAIVFFAIVFFAVNAIGTRLTGKQIDDDPSIADNLDEKQKDEDFPVDAEF